MKIPQRKVLFLTWLTVCVLAMHLNAQVATTIPEFPIISDSVVVIFNAQEGDGGLAGFTGAVYAHTGVITNQSANSHDWKHVIGSWGDNNVQPQLTSLGNDLWQLTIGDIRAFYGVPVNEKVLQLAMVFRSADTQRTGRDVGGADIFLDLFDPGLTVKVTEPVLDVSFGDPLRSPVFMNPGDTLDVIVEADTVGTAVSTFTLFLENNQVAQVQTDSLHFKFIAAPPIQGIQRFKAIAVDTAGVADSTSFVVMVNPPVQDVPRPANIIDGINVVDNATVTLSLFAPHKQFIYVIGDFSDWKVDTTYFMHRDAVNPDSVHWWITLNGLDADTEYAFQYFVDGKIRVADPFTEKILTPFDDQFIPSSTYPNLKPYPQNKTAFDVGTLQINKPQYQWQVQDFQRPDKTDLVIYELLVRDFVARHDYSTLIDTLNYLQNLGITAVELMPVTEFEGNISWGYNLAFYFAPDKYYGPENDLKRFIDECHKRGIAVILDMALNDSFGQSPLVRLYASGNFGPPTSENPWFNVTARHPFSVGFDFNHESTATKYFVDRVNAFWLQEYKVDGYRFDLAKGFTQKFSGNNVGLWGQFDASRIAILTRMANKIWAVDSTAYVILEHFAENSEEIELSNRGMMLWGNLNTAYSQSAMGFLQDPQRTSDLSWGYYKTRNWTQPNLVTYMESHDEPWLMYKNLQFGNSSGDYRIQNLSTALDRMKLVATFFLTLPGPKMMWEFEELGYDQELPESGYARVAPKPILWNYFQNPERNRLYRFFSALLTLRHEHEVFRSPDTQVSMRVGQGQFDRRIKLTNPEMNVTIIGNFNVVPLSVEPNFQTVGTWYDFFAGDSMNVTNPNASMQLQPGEFHLFTNKKLPRPDGDLITGVEERVGETAGPTNFTLFQNYPNPFNPETTIRFEVPKTANITLSVYNLLGQRVITLLDKQLQKGRYSVQWNGKDEQRRETSSGIFIVRMRTGEVTQSIKIIKLK